MVPRILGLDLETYSSAPLPKCGVYRYCDAPDFEILLFSYAFDDAPVQTIDLACGETIPKEVLLALEDPNILKIAYNAQFERVCLSKYLGHWLDPHQWRCTMVMAASLTLPGRLADVAVALGTTEKKMEEGKDLSSPSRSTCRTLLAAATTSILPRLRYSPFDPSFLFKCPISTIAQSYTDAHIPNRRISLLALPAI